MLILVGNNLVRVLLGRVLLGSGVSRISFTELLDVPEDSLIAAAALLRCDTFGNSNADAVAETAVVVLHGLQLVAENVHVVVVQLLVRAHVVLVIDELIQPANTYSKLPLLLAEHFINFTWKHI